MSTAEKGEINPRWRVRRKARKGAHESSEAPNRSEDSTKIRKLRLALDYTQEQFAHACGVTRISATAWEIGKSNPAPRAWKQMAKLAAKVAPSTAMWFWEKAGFERDDFQYLFPEFKRMVEDSELRIEQKLKSSTSDAVLVPIVRTPLPGQFRFPPSSEQIEDYLSLPTHLIQADWKLIAIRISDQFVRPIFSKGDIVVVDASSTNLIDLEGQLVVANYTLSTETQDLASMQSRGRPVAPHARGRYPFLESGMYMGWLKMDPRLPESNMRQLNLNSEKVSTEQPVTVGHEFTVPVAMVVESRPEQRIVTPESEAILVGRVVCWIAAGPQLHNS
jgi:DNA-binding XRE family transcriptional regulator